MQQRPCRISDGVCNRPDNGDVERYHPPAGKGVVQLTDAIPFVAGGRNARDFIDVLVAHDHSSSRGIRAASSASLRLPGRRAKAIAPTKKRAMATSPQLSANSRIKL